MRARPPHVYAYELPARTILHPFFSIACPAPLTPTATQKGLGGCVWRASSSLFPLFTCSSLCHFSNRFDSRKVALFWLIANCCRTENAMKWIGVYIGISCFHFRSKRMDNGNFLPRTYITTRVRFWINYFKVKSILSFFSRVKNLHFPNIIGLCDDLSNFQIPLLSIKLNPIKSGIFHRVDKPVSKTLENFARFLQVWTINDLGMARSWTLIRFPEYLARSRPKSWHGAVSEPDEWQIWQGAGRGEKSKVSLRRCPRAERYIHGRQVPFGSAAFIVLAAHKVPLHEDRSWMDRVKVHEVASLRSLSSSLPTPNEHGERAFKH